MGDDLKPCPWCGAAAEFIHGNVRRYARCSDAEANDGACGVGYRAEADWNRRPAEDTLRARAEAAEQRAEAAEQRAEAAEQRAEALAAELAQARADARVLAGLLHFDAAPGLAEISVDALTNAIGAAASLPDTEVLAVIRRALGGAA